MDAAMKSRLKAAGLCEVSVQELLGLTQEENELVETRLALARLTKHEVPQKLDCKRRMSAR